MLYELIKRDPAWRVAPKLALVSAILLPAFERSPFSFMLPALYVSLIAGFAAIARLDRRCTFLDATLPLRTQDLFLARTVSLLMFCWLPVSSGALAILAVNGQRTVSRELLEVGALMSLFTLLLLAVKPRRFTAPVWFTVLLGIVIYSFILSLPGPCGRISHPR